MNYLDIFFSICYNYSTRNCNIQYMEVIQMAMTYESVVQAARKKFLNTDVSSVPGTLAFQINLIGKVEGIFYIEIKDGRVHVEPYEYYDRNAILTMNATNFMKLINGKLDPVIAFTTGKLKVDGDVNAALEIVKFLK